MTIVWSYSNWSLFKECPYRFRAVVVDKRVPRSTSPALERGEKIHRELAARLLGQGDWPSIVPLEIRETFDRLIAHLGAPHVEQSLAVDAELRPVPFFDEAAVFRGRVDAFWLPQSHGAYIVDWKTGSSEANLQQLELMAGLVAVHVPDTYKQFNARFVYIETARFDDTSMVRITRSEAEKKLREFIDYACRIYDQNKFEPTPGSWCRWCQVSDCQFNPNRVPTFVKE